jgi:thioredoxin-dependent peroxiredoxin
MKLIPLLLALLITPALVAMENMIDPPYPAPTPVALDQDGASVDFATLYQRGTTVVFFYPKASTPGCTSQACSLRDAFQELGKLGVQVIGVSRDSAESQRAFKKAKNLPYPLIADVDGKVVAAFKVKNAIPLLSFAAREAFIIHQGKVVWHDPSASTTEQAADIKTALTKIMQ